MDITEFLLARIAEDEELARAAIAPDQMHPYGDTTIPPTPVKGWGNEVRGYLGGTWGEHCAQHDPTRVLAECAAKRAIIGLHRNNPNPYGDQYCATCSEVGQDGKDFPCETVKALAAIYADHQDYQEKWSL